MTIKSRKVGRNRFDVTTSTEEEPPRKRRKTSLAQLEKRVMRRKASKGFGGLTGILKNAGTMMSRFNKGMNQQASKMPNDRDINKTIWG